MPGPADAFLQTMIQMTQMQQARAELMLQQQNAEAQRFGMLTEIASSIVDPAQRRAFADSVQPLLPEGGPDILANLAPSMEAMRASLASRGLAGEEGIAGETAAVGFTGMSKGALASSGAMSKRDTADILLGMRTQEGLELRAGEQEQKRQFGEELGFRQTQAAIGNQQWQKSYEQNERQFGAQLAQGERQLEQGYALGKLNAFAGTPQLPIMLKAQLGGEVQRLQAQISAEPVMSRRRAQLQQELDDVNTQITEYDRWIESMTASTGRNPETMDLNQLITANATAFDNIGTAPNPAARDKAMQDYNFIQALLRARGAVLPATDLERASSWWKPRQFEGMRQVPAGGAR